MYSIAWMLLVVAQAGPVPAAPVAQSRPEGVAAPAILGPNEAARGLDTSISFAELDELLIGRRASGPKGREALKHLLHTKLLGLLAKESRLSIGSKEVDAKAKEIEARLIQSGEAASLAEFLSQSGVPLDVFREHLRLALVQETLARRALGTPPDEELNGEKQEMWLAQVLEQRGAQMPTPPWADGVAARCGDLEVSVKDFLDHLRTVLPAEDVREDCFQLLLLKRMRARMPDLAPEALAKAVDVELERRGRETRDDPRYRGLSYEQVMGAQGLPVAYLRLDPAVLIASLSTLWVDRSQGDQGLRAVYAKERELFDGRFGEAVDARMLFLRASSVPNPLIPRDFPAAEMDLSKWKETVRTADEFGKLARERSEEPFSREKDGRVGFVTRGDDRLPPEVREALFAAKPAVVGTPMVGPVRVQGGACLLWVGVRRPAPGWEEMSLNVHRELRRRFIEELLTRDAVYTYLNKP